MSSEEVGALKRFWHFLGRPSAKYSLVALLAVGFVGGIIFWGGFNTALEATNTLDFCISCHEMRDTVYQEYQQTVHFKNRTGVRAVCPDCHVPRDWTHKIARKMRATFELWGKLTGEVDTPEKFEANRMRLASDEWARMEKAKSRECFNCHSFDGMQAAKQKPMAQKNHAKAQLEGKTCIDCHKGIAHLLPKEYKGEDEE
ncbi:nitrate reductase, cytochrome c-type,periplasmic [Burkholderiales bacterium]|nr:nitrate reductase, cytochrome c-type,periplasmic [Burkholderiales bacterium]